MDCIYVANETMKIGGVASTPMYIVRSLGCDVLSIMTLTALHQYCLIAQADCVLYATLSKKRARTLMSWVKNQAKKIPGNLTGISENFSGILLNRLKRGSNSGYIDNI